MAERDELLNHNYDGIQEYDNDLPRWWVGIFWLTGIFSVFYIGYIHYYAEPQHERLAKQLEVHQQKIEERAVKEAAAAPAVSEESLLALTKDDAALAIGKTQYDSKCAACHRVDGGGMIGPNFTDDHWLHGGSLMDIRRVVIEGVPDKGMVSWKGLLSDSEINSVVAYIWNMYGTNPENPKAPQGEVFKR